MINIRVKQRVYSVGSISLPKRNIKTQKRIDLHTEQKVKQPNKSKIIYVDYVKYITCI